MYPSPEQQRDQIYQRVREASGRLLTKGLGNQVIPCLKYIIGPDQATVDDVTVVANIADRSGGDWVGVVDPGINEIIFFKYISCISIPDLIEDTYEEVPPMKDRKKLIRMGDDPVTMTAPYYDGTWVDIDRVLAQAISMKALRPRYGEYIFKMDGVEAALGVDLNAMRECLKSNSALATRIHMEFSRMLAIRQDEFIDEIMRLQSSQRGWGVVGLPKDAMKEAYEIACLLLPHVSRSGYVEMVTGR